MRHLHRADRWRLGSLLRHPDRRLRWPLDRLGTRNDPDPVQQAFIAEQAAQCGYCLNGMIMTTKALLLRNPHPTEQETMDALRYNLCRCGAHVEIVRAVMRAAGAAAEAHD